MTSRAMLSKVFCLVALLLLLTPLAGRTEEPSCHKLWTWELADAATLVTRYSSDYQQFKNGKMEKDAFFREATNIVVDFERVLSKIDAGQPCPHAQNKYAARKEWILKWGRIALAAMAAHEAVTLFSDPAEKQ